MIDVVIVSIVIKYEIICFIFIIDTFSKVGIISIDKEKEINVIVKSLDASCVTIETRAWVSQDAYWDTRFILFERFKQVFDENGIEIPFNQLDVTLKQ